MKTTITNAEMTGSELADLIKSFEDEMAVAKTDAELEHARAKMKALLFDVRDPIMYALRLVDVINSAEAL